LGLPTTVGKDYLGASSPEKPTLILEDPLSITTGTDFYPSIKQEYKEVHK
jgi:hypothetical protein